MSQIFFLKGLKSQFKKFNLDYSIAQTLNINQLINVKGQHRTSTFTLLIQTIIYFFLSCLFLIFHYKYHKMMDKTIVVNEQRVEIINGELILRLPFSVDDLKPLIQQIIAEPIIISLLSFQNKRLGPQGVRLLVSIPFQHLTELNLHYNNIGSKGARWLEKSSFDRLNTLILSLNNLGSEGMKYLSNGTFKNITALFLGFNSVGLEGVKHLVNGHFPNLLKLYLDHNKIDGEGVKILGNGSFVNLKLLYLGFNQVWSEAKLRFEKFNKVSQSGSQIALKF